MSDLAEFLLARIAADERRLDLPEFVEEDSARGPGWGNRSDCPVCGAYQFSGYEPVTQEAWWDHAETVHQRTRVLAKCKADRLIVAIHAAGEHLCPSPDALEDGLWSVTDQDVMTPCPTLRLLALPYADHPDYRQEWALAPGGERAP